MSKDGVPLHLTLKCMELLIAFVRNPGKTLTKEDLLEQAWPDPTASDATLAQHVFLLRRALRTGSHEWIRTVPNVGYRFAAEVLTIDDGDDEHSRALHAYMESARHFRDIASERALRSAIDLCSHAIALEDAGAAAYALRASCWRLLAESMYVEPLPCLRAAQSDAHAALTRDPRNADAHIEAASCAALLDRDAIQVRRHLDAASRLQPVHPGLPHARVWLALMCGRLEEALCTGRAFGGALFGAALYMSGDFARALDIFSRSADGDPAVRVMRGSCRLLMNDIAGALDDFQAVYYAESVAVGRASVRHYALGLYVYALARGGDVTAARVRVREMERLARQRYVSPMARAAAHLGLHDVGAAVECVREARRRYDPWSALVPVDPVFAELRSVEAFAALIRSAA